MLTNCWKFPNRNVQTFGFVYHDKRNLYGHPLAGLLWERQFEKILLKHGWEKEVPNWGMSLCTSSKRLFLSVYVDDIKLAGMKQNLDPMWKLLDKEVDLGEPTSFLDHVFLGCTQRTMWNKQKYCGQLQNHVRIAEFQRREQKNFHSLKIFVFLHGLMIWKVMQRNVWSDTVSWPTRRTQQLYKVSTPCIDDHHFKEEEMKSVGESSQVCSHIVLKCL